VHSCGVCGDGAYRDRTGDLRLAKEAQGRSRRYVAQLDRMNKRSGVTAHHPVEPEKLTSENTDKLAARGA